VKDYFGVTCKVKLVEPSRSSAARARRKRVVDKRKM